MTFETATAGGYPLIGKNRVRITSFGVTNLTQKILLQM